SSVASRSSSCCSGSSAPISLVSIRRANAGRAISCDPSCTVRPSTRSVHEMDESSHGLIGLTRQQVLLIAGLSLAILVGPAIIAGSFSYNRWDTFEYYTPIVTQVHGALLDGVMPFINYQQHLGEPIQANMQSAPLYVPYTFAVALIRLLGLAPETLTTIVVAV